MRPAESSQPRRPGADPLQGRPGAVPGQPRLPSPQLTAKAVVQVIASDGPPIGPKPSLRTTAVTVYLLVGSSLLALLLLLTALCRARDQAIHPDSFDSDRMLCFAICRDVLGSGYPLTSWHIPGPPYVFPDITLLLPCTLLSADLTLAFLLYHLLLYAGVMVGLFWIARQSGIRPLEACLLACAGMTLTAVAGLPQPQGDRTFAWFDLMWFYPGQHSGAILTGLWLMALVLRSLRQGWGPVSGAVFVLLGGIGAFSDKVLVAQFLAPMALALMLLGLSGVLDRQRRAVNLSLLLIVGAVLLSFAITQWFLSLGFVMCKIEPEFHPANMEHCIKRFFPHLPESIWATPVFLVILPLFLLTGLAVVVGWVWSGRKHSEPMTGARHNSDSPMASATADDRPSNPREGERPAALAVALMGLLSPLCNLAAVLAAGMWGGQGEDRYLLALVFVPCLLPALFLRLAPWKSTRVAALALPGIIAAYAAHQVYAPARAFHWADLHQPYPEWVQVVDQLARERGFKRGLANFWCAKSLTFLSKEKLLAKAIIDDGRPYPHADNSASFLTPDARDLTIPEYQFIVLLKGDSPNADQIVQHYGEPVEKKIVGDREIWTYNRMRSPDLDRFLAGLLAVKLRRQCHVITPLSPADLAHPKTNFSPSQEDQEEVQGNVPLKWGHELEARFAGPVSGRLLDIAAHSNAAYELTFYRAETQVGKLAVPTVTWAEKNYNGPCLYSRLLAIPDNLRGQSWDRVVIRPVSGPGPFTVGHLLVLE